MIGASVPVMCTRNPKIQVRALPGHFAMTHAHTNFYVDIMETKLNQKMAADAAALLAEAYAYEQQIDTIVSWLVAVANGNLKIDPLNPVLIVC